MVWHTNTVVTNSHVHALLYFYLEKCANRSVHINTGLDGDPTNKTYAKSVITHEDIMRVDNDSVTLFICSAENPDP